MIDHTGFVVSDFEKSKEFYTKALAPLGYPMLMQIPASPGRPNIAGFGEKGGTDFWIHDGTPNTPRLHIAFRAKTRADVDAFYQAAMSSGGRDNGPPGLRAHYHPAYYAAFVLDPDGHNIEAVCHDLE